MKYNDNGEIKDLKVKAIAPFEVKNARTENPIDTYSCDYINGMNGKLLWKNNDINTSFSEQTIILNNNDYDFLAIYYISKVGENYYLYNEFPKNCSCKLQNIQDLFLSGKSYLATIWRNVNYISETELRFKDTSMVSSYSGTITLEQRNVFCIPVYIIGYKKNIDLMN